jgi:hypothetical protein
LLVAAIVACWPVFHPLTKALTCGLGLTLAAAAVYWLARPRKKRDDALKESHYEKFQRLVGISLTIPETVRNQPENAAAARSFETQGIFGPATSNSRPDCALLSHSVRITSLLKWNSCRQQFILQFLGSARRQLAPQEFFDLARFRVEKLCQDFDVVALPGHRYKAS